MADLTNFQVVDNVTDVLAAQYNMLLGSNLQAQMVNTVTMTGTLALTDTDLPIQRLNANGANRTVKLPAYASTNHPFMLVNATNAAYVVTVYDSSGVLQLATLNDGGSVLFIPDGASGYKYAVSPGGFIYGTTAIILNARTARAPFPSALQAEDIIFRFGGGGHNGTAWLATNQAAIDFMAAENWDASARGTYIKFQTAATGNNGMAECLRLTPAGHIKRSLSVARNANSFSKTSDTTLANITGITVNLEAAKVYKFRAVLFTTSNVAGGVKAAISGTATMTSITYHGKTYELISKTVGTARATALGTTVGDITAVTAALVEIEGTCVVNAAGTLTVQFAQNASHGTSSVVLAGSYLEVEEMA